MNNCYEDAKRATDYAGLQFSGTYYLAFRDLPEIIANHVKGNKAIDLGCGTGRSTRFLEKLGFATVGVDIARNMINKAREINPGGDYRLISNADFSQFPMESYDLILAAFTFDNIPTVKDKINNLKAMRGLLSVDGIIIILVSSPEMYINEWLSFSTCNFPENKLARSGDKVRNLIIDIGDNRPVEDYLCFDQDYKEMFATARLGLIATYKPLGRTSEPYAWVNETRISPWVIYVLAKK